MRMKKTLWKLVLIDFHKHFTIGLCAVIDRMLEAKRITMTERNYLISEIKLYRSECEHTSDSIFYIWTPKEASPRIKFIKDQIKKNSTNKK